MQTEKSRVRTPKQIISRLIRELRLSKAAEHVSVLVRFYNRNGAFKSQWYTTEKTEFTRIEK